LRFIITIVFILFLVIFSFAQKGDSTSQQNQGIISKARKTLQSVQGKIPDTNLSRNAVTDTIKTPKLDSLAAKQKLDSIRRVMSEKKIGIYTITDSVKRVMNLPQEKISQLNRTVQSQQDSLFGIITRPIDDVNTSISEKQHVLVK
jgi:hypothetical protein